MPESNKPSLPQDMITLSQAVAQSLESLNAVSQRQQQDTVTLAGTLLQVTVELLSALDAFHPQNQTPDHSNSPSALAEQVKKLNVAIATPPSDPTTPADKNLPAKAQDMALGNLELAASQAVSNAYHNAVNTQQQINAISQAALAQGLAAFYGVFAVLSENKNVDLQKLKPLLQSLTSTANPKFES